MSKEELEKRGAVVVTGGSSGIGAATVRAFSDTHLVVFACDCNPVAQDAQFPPNVRFVQADISSESDVARLAGIVAAEGIPLDVIVNNAGITHIASDRDNLDRRLAPGYGCEHHRHVLSHSELATAVAFSGRGNCKRSLRSECDRKAKQGRLWNVQRRDRAIYQIASC
jgi:NAD(P)-dependent dehydrogenase (short-subunit alcohol dehydrogenase family)